MDDPQNLTIKFPMVTKILTSQGLMRQKAQLLVTHGPDVGAGLVVIKDRVLVGSFKGSDLVLTDVHVSRNHFEIVAEDEGYLLRDLGSTNGTFVEGHKVREIFLKRGSRVQVGETQLVFQPLNERTQVPLSAKDQFGSLIGRSLKMREIFAILERVAASEAPVIVEGETGTGKELVAKSIHRASSRGQGPFIVFDCGAVQPNLADSQLFGHERGSYTGAIAQRKGAFELAHQGTLFIDELAELPLDLQPKLLRVLETGEVKRLGGNKTVKVDVRVIAATNKSLERMVNDRAFREDLFYRVAVIRVTLPPLRSRKEDIPLLVEHFIKQEAGRAFRLPEEMMERLRGYHWPGNVRELRNFISRTVALSTVDASPDLHSLTSPPSDQPSPQVELGLPYKEAKAKWVQHFERTYLQALLERTGGNISQASREAGIDRMYVQKLVRKHEIKMR